MDWAGVVVNLTGWYLMPHHRRAALALFMVSNAVWICWALANGVWSIVFIQICYVVLNIRTLRAWRKS